MSLGVQWKRSILKKTFIVLIVAIVDTAAIANAVVVDLNVVMAVVTFAAEVVILRQQLFQILIILKTELRPTSQQCSLPTFQTN